MAHYFAELVLTDLSVVIVGGGRVATRKLTSLLECGARVTVVAPQLCAEMAQCGPHFNHLAHTYDPGMLSRLARPVLVFAATSDPVVNGQVAEECKQLGILCNVVDDPAASGFLVPATLRRPGLTVAIGTGGHSPALARVLKEHLATRLHPGWGPLIEAFGALRSEVRQCLDPGQREKFWRKTALLALQEEQFLREDGEEWLRCQLQKAMAGGGDSKPGGVE